MRDVLPPARLADLLATFDPTAGPTVPEWTDLCSALDAYDHAAQLGLNTEDARNQVDTAAMIFHLRYDDDLQPRSGLPEHRAAR